MGHYFHEELGNDIRSFLLQNEKISFDCTIGGYEDPFFQDLLKKHGLQKEDFPDTILVISFTKKTVEEKDYSALPVKSRLLEPKQQHCFY